MDKFIENLVHELVKSNKEIGELKAASKNIPQQSQGNSDGQQAYVHGQVFSIDKFIAFHETKQLTVIYQGPFTKIRIHQCWIEHYERTVAVDNRKPKNRRKKNNQQQGNNDVPDDMKSDEFDYGNDNEEDYHPANNQNLMDAPIDQDNDQENDDNSLESETHPSKARPLISNKTARKSDREIDDELKKIIGNDSKKPVKDGSFYRIVKVNDEAKAQENKGPFAVKSTEEYERFNAKLKFIIGGITNDIDFVMHSEGSCVTNEVRLVNKGGKFEDKSDGPRQINFKITPVHEPKFDIKKHLFKINAICSLE